MAEQNLKDKTVKGVAWSGIDNVVQHVVSFLVGIVLARLLTPDDYGLIGIIAIFTAICNTLINGGFTSALIRKKEITDDDYNTAFIINLGMSVFLYIVIYFLSPLIAHFFGREELVSLTRFTSLGIIIGALGIVQQTRLTKRIDFKSQTKISILASVVSGLVGIIMALLGFGVWSLVAQLLLSQSLRTILLWFANRWIPNLHFSAPSFRNLFGFGWKIMVSGLLNTIWNELYQVVVGKYYSPATLGQYTRAKQFSQLFSTNITNVVQRVTYPVLSNIQDDKERMVSAYRYIIKITMFFTAVCMFWLGAVSEPLLYCLIGEKWHEAATYLPLICISMSLYPLHAINLNMLQVQGRSDLFLLLEIIKKIIALGPLFIGAFIGILPMLYTNILTGILSYFLNSYYTGKFLGYSSLKQLNDVAPSYILAITIAIPVWVMKYIPISNWGILPLQIIVGASIFFVICKAFRMSEYSEVIKILKPILLKIKGK